MLLASFETARELVVHFNNKTLLSKHWQTARQMLTLNPTYCHDVWRCLTVGGEGSLWRGMSGVLPPPFICAHILSDYTAKSVTY